MYIKIISNLGGFMKSKKNNMKHKFLATAVMLASGFAVYIAYNTRCNDYKEAIQVSPVVSEITDKQIFTEIYNKQQWNKLAGPEVNKDEQGHHPFTDFLQDFIITHNISDIFDMGCGYGELLKDLHLPANSSYLGLDIVDSVIAYNKLHYERPNVSYDTVDDVKDLAKYKGDLLILKDVIQHWSIEKIMYARDHILPNFKYAIIVNNIFFPNLGAVNSEINTGSSRPLNLEISPFYMKLKVINDYKIASEGIKRIYLYENNKYKAEIQKPADSQ